MSGMASLLVGRLAAEHPACELVVVAETRHVWQQVTGVHCISAEMRGEANLRQTGARGIHVGVAHKQGRRGRYPHTVQNHEQRVCGGLGTWRISHPYDDVEKAGNASLRQQNVSRGPVPVCTDAKLPV